MHCKPDTAHATKKLESIQNKWRWNSAGHVLVPRRIEESSTVAKENIDQVQDCKRNHKEIIFVVGFPVVYQSLHS